jgi:hypothetical protein
MAGMGVLTFLQTNNVMAIIPVLPMVGGSGWLLGAMLFGKPFKNVLSVRHLRHVPDLVFPRFDAASV